MNERRGPGSSVSRGFASPNRSPKDLQLFIQKDRIQFTLVSSSFARCLWGVKRTGENDDPEDGENGTAAGCECNQYQFRVSFIIFPTSPPFSFSFSIGIC